jgi:hypothetical protein
MADELPERLRRRLDEVFGDVLPNTTSDELGDDDPPAADPGEQQLLAERPPHHDQER